MNREVYINCFKDAANMKESIWIDNPFLDAV